MGRAHANIGLSNPRLSEGREVAVHALADTGSDYLCLPADVVLELGLEGEQRRTVATADGISRSCRYVGPVRVRFDDRECYVGALEIGTEVLLGAIPMEDMDLVIHPKSRAVIANPEHLNGPQGFAKGFQS